MFEITRGKAASPVRCCLYGVEGVGKTTFAAKWPGAVFIDVEGGSKHYDVARFPKPVTWDELLAEVKAAASAKEVGTLVIDTMDAAEELCVSHIIKKHNKTSMEDWAYQAGWRYVFEEFKKLMAALDAVSDAGKNIVLVAHAVITKFEQPDELGAYDRYELKLHKGKNTNTGALVKEWADLLLFVNFKADVMTDEKTKKTKATGGKRRVMYASHAAAYDAKNRLGLPDEMPFEFEQIAHVVPAAEQPKAKRQPKPKPAPEPEPELEQPKAATDEADDGAVKVSTAEQLKAGALEDEDREHKAVLLTLNELMLVDNVKPAELQGAVASRANNPYTATTPIEDYSTEFVRDILIVHWAAIKATISELKVIESKPGGGVYDSEIPF